MLLVCKWNFNLEEKKWPASLAFVGVEQILCTHRNIVKSGEMKHEKTLFHTKEPNRNVLFQTRLLFGTIEVFMTFLTFKYQIGIEVSLKK